MNLPKEIITVTTVSKSLAMFLFITVPFVGFLVGLKYQQQFTEYIESRASVDQYLLKNQPAATQSALIANWKTYTNSDIGYTFKYPTKGYETVSDNEFNYSERYNTDIPKSFSQFMGYNPPKLINAIRIIQEIPDGVISANDLVFSLWIFDNLRNDSINQWYQKYWYYPFNWGQATNSGVEKNKPNRVRIVGDLQAQYAVRDSKGKVQYIYVSTKNKMFLFAVLGKPASSTIGNQILSTFKFTP